MDTRKRHTIDVAQLRKDVVSSTRGQEPDYDGRVNDGRLYWERLGGDIRCSKTQEQLVAEWNAHVDALLKR